ncbi:MAG TPA: transcription antitermination factor NusB [Terriglobia bacterium]|jgi:N utilization substance protein B|nr:transcription antitermination factor NusB [Terriglobia bacterium]
MPARHKSRELALQMLFQWEVGQHTPGRVVATFLPGLKADDEVKEFARVLFEGTVSGVDGIDPLLRRHAEHWKLERMAAVDRNVLRLALYELLHHPETPPPVVINEALELARRYSTPDAVEFVNGVLDAVRKSLASPGQSLEG